MQRIPPSIVNVAFENEGPGVMRDESLSSSASTSGCLRSLRLTSLVASAVTISSQSNHDEHAWRIYPHTHHLGSDWMSADLNFQDFNALGCIVGALW